MWLLEKELNAYVLYSQFFFTDSVQVTAMIKNMISKKTTHQKSPNLVLQILNFWFTTEI